MALDFPASPSLNQTYSGPGGVVWVWDGAKWVSGTGSTVYAPVTSPVFLGNPTAPNPPAGDADTSVATTSFVAAAVGTALHDTGRNLLHNPLFNVAQRGAGPFTAAAYTLDRWGASINGGDTASFQQLAQSDATRAAIGDDAATWYLSNTFVGNAAAGASNYTYQPIEDVRRLSGKTAIVSFWAAAGTAGQKLGVSFYQSFGTGGSPSALVAVNGQAVTLTTSFVRYSVTLAVPSVAGKTLGTNGNHCTLLCLWYSSGSGNNVLSGGVGVQSGTIALWGCQLEVGSVATPLEKIDPRIDLANCQRFYQTGTFDLEVYQAAGIYASYNTHLPAAMRATPAINTSGTATTNVSVTGVNAPNPYSIHIYAQAVATNSIVWSGNYTASADL